LHDDFDSHFVFNELFTHMNIYIYITKLYDILLLLLLFFIDTKVYLKLTRYQQTFEWQAFVEDDDDAKYCVIASSNQMNLCICFSLLIYTHWLKRKVSKRRRERERDREESERLLCIYIYIYEIWIYTKLIYIYICAWVGRSIQVLSPSLLLMNASHSISYTDEVYTKIKRKNNKSPFVCLHIYIYTHTNRCIMNEEDTWWDTG
jgi:membrane-anchored protein YejM (alkaline phosphatase superfamily)